MVWSCELGGHIATREEESRAYGVAYWDALLDMKGYSQRSALFSLLPQLSLSSQLNCK
jgi:hypothetical protein